jgi:L-lysine exporter family protein LysE/ArgO
MAASWLFFFALGYGAGLVRPILARKEAWQIFETLIGICMWAIAASLLFEA